ncbi:winged helix-turn-helix domain-containing protein [Aliikangiella sp. IMCC44359]|uniref:winged helix-turn-helix domain-containing protein n=1 Tax=Aliikangiella sp. IMCC44359 TaxID=3459125 RepID=UPI00403ABAC2
MFKNSGAKRQFQIADIKLDPETNQVWQGDEEISLPKLSYQLLKVLVENAPTVLAQDELIRQVWPHMVVGDETLKQRIRLLRKAIGDNAQSPKYIGVVRGLGYRIIPEVKICLTPRSTPIVYDLASSDRPPNIISSTTNKLWRNIAFSLIIFIVVLSSALLTLNQQINSQAQHRSIQNLAVLPFVNITQNKEDDYLASGMTDELITVMSEIDSLRISPLNSVNTYKNSGRSVRKVAQDLNVGAILDGAIYRQNNLIHFSFKLIDTNTSTQLWQAEYDFESDDIIAIQRKVITQVASHLKAKLNKPAILDSLSLTQPTQVVQAYHYYLRGKNYYARYRRQDNLTAVALFQESLQLDPDFGLAYAGLADAYSQGFFQFAASENWRELSLKAALKATSLAPEKADSHKALGLAYYLNGSITQGIESNLRAIKLSPRHPQAATNLAYLYFQKGQLDNALRWNIRAQELAPNYATVYAHMGLTLENQKRYLEAEKSFLKALQLQPDYAFAIGLYTKYLSSQAQLPLARKLIQDAIKKSPSEISLLTLAGEIELIHGNFIQAASYYQQAIEQQPSLKNLELELLNNITLAGIGKHHSALKNNIIQWQNTRMINNEKPRDYYLLALAYAVLNQHDKSAEMLTESISKGWMNINQLNQCQLLEKTLTYKNVKTSIAEVNQKLNQMSNHMNTKL